nr:hypothetical protein [Tanacetum cinerariifolium]
QEERKIEEEQAANARYWNILACCDDDDDSAITPNKPVDSLSMGDEHLNTILETESDKFIKSCVENLVPKPNDSCMEEIDLSFNPDDPMPLGIEEDDDDSERDILILEELPRNYSLSLPVNESFYFDIPSFSRPPAKPPDGNTRILNIKMMGDNSEQKVKDKQRKGQNQNKTEQKGEAWKSPAMSKSSHSQESRKTKENKVLRDQRCKP